MLFIISLQLIGKIYLHYKHIDWAAVSLEKSVIPYLSDPESGAIPDTEAMLLLAGTLKIPYKITLNWMILNQFLLSSFQLLFILNIMLYYIW